MSLGNPYQSHRKETNNKICTKIPNQVWHSRAALQPTSIALWYKTFSFCAKPWMIQTVQANAVGWSTGANHGRLEIHLHPYHVDETSYNESVLHLDICDSIQQLGKCFLQALSIHRGRHSDQSR